LNKPLADKATATTSASPHILGTSSLAEFTAFQDSSVEHLLHVAKDSSILFKSVDKSPAQLVALIQAKELAQAELAAARKKVEEEENKRKEEEDLKGSTSVAAASSPPRESPRGTLSTRKGKARRSPIRTKRTRAAARPNPLGSNPLSRRARVQQQVPQ
jgi:hypothetical protein